MSDFRAFQRVDLPQHLIAIGLVRAFHNRVQSHKMTGHWNLPTSFVEHQAKIKLFRRACAYQVPEIIFLTGVSEISNQNSLTARTNSDIYRHQSQPRHYSDADMRVSRYLARSCPVSGSRECIRVYYRLWYNYYCRGFLRNAWHLRALHYLW